MTKRLEEIELNLPRDLLYNLMLEAHKQDITLNKLINNILKSYLKKQKTYKSTSTFYTIGSIEAGKQVHTKYNKAIKNLAKR